MLISSLVVKFTSCNANGVTDVTLNARVTGFLRVSFLLLNSCVYLVYPLLDSGEYLVYPLLDSCVYLVCPLLDSCVYLVYFKEDRKRVRK